MTLSHTTLRLVSLPAIIATIIWLSWGACSCTHNPPNTFKQAQINGIDVSAHNGAIDFHAVRADSVDFVLIKATEGGTFKDSAFHSNIEKAIDAGLHVGAYHFFRFETNGLMQALNLINSVRGHHLDLPIAIDIEEWGNPNVCTTSEIMGRVREMADYLQAQGYPVMIYTNRDGYERFVLNQLERLPLWICSFTTPELPSRNNMLKIWQHTHRGRIRGIKGNVDRNAFMGSRTEYQQWLNSLTFPPQYND